MRFKKNALILVMIVVLLIVVGCSSKVAVSENIRNSANDITEGILNGMNEDNYAKFSDDFDQTMKSSMSESQFITTNENIKNKIGKYISKQYVTSEKQDGYSVVIYKGKFSQEKDDVIIKTVLSETNGKIFVSGFWLDSPNLRK